MEEERESLEQLSSIEILDYIRQSVEILMGMKTEEFAAYQQALKDRGSREEALRKIERDLKNKEERAKERNNNKIVGESSQTSTTPPIPEDYEKMIQKLEADIRTHIRTEQQLKLHIESLNYQGDETERAH